MQKEFWSNDFLPHKQLTSLFTQDTLLQAQEAQISLFAANSLASCQGNWVFSIHLFHSLGIHKLFWCHLALIYTISQDLVMILTNTIPHSTQDFYNPFSLDIKVLCKQYACLTNHLHCLRSVSITILCHQGNAIYQGYKDSSRIRSRMWVLIF